MVAEGQTPQPMVDYPAHGIWLSAGGQDFSGELLDRLDQAAQEIAALDPQLASALLIAPRASRHLTIAALVYDRPEGPVDFDLVTPNLKQIQDMLNRHRPIRVRFTGLNLAPDGSVIAEGHVEDESLFEIRNALGELFPEPRRRSPMVQMNVVRPIQPLTPEQFQRLYDWVAQRRDMPLGDLTITRPFLRRVESRFGFTDTAPHRIEFRLQGGADQAPQLLPVRYVGPVTYPQARGELRVVRDASTHRLSVQCSGCQPSEAWMLPYLNIGLRRWLEWLVEREVDPEQLEILVHQLMQPGVLRVSGVDEDLGRHDDGHVDFHRVMATASWRPPQDDPNAEEAARRYQAAINEIFRHDGGHLLRRWHRQGILVLPGESASNWPFRIPDDPQTEEEDVTDDSFTYFSLHPQELQDWLSVLEDHTYHLKVDPKYRAEEAR